MSDRLRKVLLFVAGLIAFVWQVLFEKNDRPLILVLIAGMVGVSLTLTEDKENK